MTHGYTYPWQFGLALDVLIWMPLWLPAVLLLGWTLKTIIEH